MVIRPSLRPNGRIRALLGTLGPESGHESGQMAGFTKHIVNWWQ